MLGRVGQCLAQHVGKREAVQYIGLERGQALTEVLQGVQLAFDLRLALLFEERIVVVIFSHGGGPEENAAMITSRGPLVRPGRIGAGRARPASGA
ncbi:hypothetical protein D3C80_2002210 [compost metagenome]